MAIVINFQEYVNSKAKKENSVKGNIISTEIGRIIYFNKEVIEQ